MSTHTQGKIKFFRSKINVKKSGKNCNFCGFSSECQHESKDTEKEQQALRWKGSLFVKSLLNVGWAVEEIFD